MVLNRPSAKLVNTKSNLLTPRRSIYRSWRRRPIWMPEKTPKAFQRHTFPMPVKKAHVNPARQRLGKIRVCRRHVGPLGTMPGNQVPIHSLASTRSNASESRLQVVNGLVDPLAAWIVVFGPGIRPNPIPKDRDSSRRAYSRVLLKRFGSRVTRRSDTLKRKSAAIKPAIHGIAGINVG